MVSTSRGNDLTCMVCRLAFRGGLGTVVDTAESSHASSDAKRQRAQVVATFEKRDQPSAGHQVRRPGSEVREVAGGKPEIGQWISAMRVEACRDEQPSWSELLSQGRDHLVERQTVGIACGSSRKRQVHGGALPRTCPDLAQRAGPGVERELVERDVKHVRTLVEDLLSPVAVVGVPVEHHDVFALSGKHPGCDRYIVEQTKAHRPRP